MISCLLIAALLPAVFNVLRARQLTHIAFFSAGYLYYWVLPLFIGQVQLFNSSSDNGFGSWADFFQTAPQSQLEIYAASILVFYLSFILGDTLARKTAPLLRQTASTPPLTFVFVPYTLVFLVAAGYVYHLRSLLGADYGLIGGGIFSMGTLAALSLTLLAMALLKTTASEQATFLATISNRWMLGFYIISFLQLTMGGRLYFVSSLLLLAGYRSVFFKRFSARQLLAFVLGAAMFAGAAGLLRLKSGINAVAVILNLAGEPVFTSFSLFSFLGSNHIPWIEFPRFLAGDFLNLIPSAIFPNKIALLPDPARSGFFFESPMGALNSWVSFIINFGLIGTAIVMMLIGFFLRRLLTNAAISPLRRTQYLMCSGFMVFTFFRDPFSVSLVKNFFEFSLIMPFACAHISNWLVWSAGAHGQMREPTSEPCPR